MSAEVTVAGTAPQRQLAPEDVADAATRTPLLLAPEDVAVELSISRHHVFKLMRDGDLPFVRVGRFYRVATADLRDFVANHRATSSASSHGLRVRVRASVSG